jgi:hypothetical protein
MTNREVIHEAVQFVNGAMTITVDVEPSSQTVWRTLDQMCLLFEKDKSTISRHIKNVFKEGEVSQISGLQKMQLGQMLLIQEQNARIPWNAIQPN